MAKQKNIEIELNSKGCWRCVSHGKDRNGYPLIWGFRGKGLRTPMHRHIYQLLHRRELPTNIVVRHTCDVRDCINPHHLVEGTQAENVQDTVSRRRQYGGERHWTHKLTDKDVEYIRGSSETQRSLADKFGVGQGHISHIKNGLSRNPEKIPITHNVYGGERHWNLKLTNEQIQYIRTSKTTQRLIAKELGVSQSTISQIRNGLRRSSG